MKNKIIIDEKSAIEYIEKVLTEWTAFCESHILLKQALEVLLKVTKDNIRLRADIERLYFLCKYASQHGVPIDKEVDRIHIEMWEETNENIQN